MKKILHMAVIALSLIGVFGMVTATASSTALASTQSQVKSGVTGVGGNESGNSGNNVVIVIKNVINILLFLVAMIAVIMIVIAGFRFVTSNGDSNTVSSAKNAIIYAVIGIVIAVMAYAIVNFILDNLT